MLAIVLMGVLAVGAQLDAFATSSVAVHNRWHERCDGDFEWRSICLFAEDDKNRLLCDDDAQDFREQHHVGPRRLQLLPRLAELQKDNCMACVCVCVC